MYMMTNGNMWRSEKDEYGNKANWGRILEVGRTLQQVIGQKTRGWGRHRAK